MATFPRLSSFAKKKLFLFLFAVVFMFFSVWLYLHREAINEYIPALAGAMGRKPILGVLIFIVISALSSVLSPFSSLIILQPAIVAWGKTLTFIYLIFGWTIGSILGYVIGFYALSGLFRKIFSFKKINYYQEKLSPQTQFWIVLIFRLGAPTEITGYALGIIRYHFKKYILAVILSEIPFALLSVYSSSALFGGRIISFSILIVMTVTLVISTSLIFRKYIK